ncbi:MULTISPECIES: hypothetical protein [Rhodococcus]|uniref:hypothetical protein n=1 Tax=Rhodococcus TaxID=1827 RepID=UPI00071D54A3|nr:MULTISPECIES: hypothetical protein [Rhodococcus]ANQ75660.1 hypothetical protein AOT96_32120 [Rhodococcus sp. 008]KSU70647.1 hypothetical protein AS032_27310 [Rhodococcus qingshengii]SCC64366.1 hypothetical protein GA0061093_117130 [Rhodococcus qingshengii]
MSRPAVDIELANRARTELAHAIRAFLRERTAVDSPLFDVSAKMVYGNYASARSLPLLMDLVNAKATPEEIGERLKTVGVQLGLVMNGIGWVYTLGRIQQYLDAGWPQQTVTIADDDRAAEVFTWWARIMQCYRNDGHLVPGYGGAAPIFTTLSEDTVRDLAAAAAARGPITDPGTLRRAVAELDMYEFVTHAEARDGIHHHGPYPLGDGRVMLVKEFTDLQGQYMPSKTDEHRLDVSRIVIALVLRDVDIRFDIFAIFAEPENYLDRAEAVQILAGDDLEPITIDQLGVIAASSVHAQRKYFLAMAGWDERTKVTHAASQYANDFHALMLLAGYTQDEISDLFVTPFEKNAEEFFDRSTGPERMQIFEHVLGDSEPISPNFQE